MYMGQEQWAGQAAVTQEVGNATQISLIGCKDQVVGPVIRGEYTMSSLNHGKPVYRRDAHVNGLQVMIYYWDERDGAGSAGWWIGPKVGSEQVWAHNAATGTKTPPASGWKVPHTGPVDTTMQLGPKGTAQNGAQQGQQMGLGQQLQQQGSWGQQAQSQQQQWQQQQQALQRQQRVLQQQQMEEQRKKQQEIAVQMKQKQQMEAAAGVIRKEAAKLKAVSAEKFEEQKEELQKVLSSGLEACGELAAKVQAECEEAVAACVKRLESIKEFQAANGIRKYIQKVRTAQIEQYEDAKKEMQEQLEQLIAGCGSQQDKVREEVAKAIEQNDKRIEIAKEQKVKTDAQRAEQEQKRKEAEAKAIELLKELQVKVAEAEEETEALKKELESFAEGVSSLSVDDIDSTASSVAESAEALKVKQEAISAFVRANSMAMKAFGWTAPKKAGEASEEAAEDKPPTLVDLTKRNAVARASMDESVRKLEATKTSAVKASAAREAYNKARGVVAKFDKDKDGFLTKAEVKKYAKDVQKIDLTEKTLKPILDRLCGEDSKEPKVKVEDFQRLKVFVGIARENVRDEKRRKLREEKEAAHNEKKAELQKKLDVVLATLEKVEEVAKEKEVCGVQMFQKGKTMTATEMLAEAKSFEEALAGVRTSSEEVKTSIEQLGEAEDALKHWFNVEKKKLSTRTDKVDSSLVRSTAAFTKFTEDAKKKDQKEVGVLKKKAVSMMRFHKDKKGLDNDGLFAEFAKKADKITKAQFVKFFSTCEKEVVKEPSAEEKAKAEEEAKKKEEEEKKQKEEEEKKEAEAKGKGKRTFKRAPKPLKEEEKEPDLASIVLTDDDLKRIFDSWGEESEGAITKEAFSRIIRLLMKVVKETVLTDKLKVKESGTPVCRLAVGDVVEVHMGPVKDEDSGLSRIQVKCIKDGTAGWASVVGTQGTVYFEEGGGAYKVVKETIMTDDFDISSKDSIRKVKDDTRKLKVGELLDVYEWGKKDEGSGLTRMKVKARSDGQVGWVTSLGNTGTAYVEPL